MNVEKKPIFRVYLIKTIQLLSSIVVGIALGIVFVFVIVGIQFLTSNKRNLKNIN